MKWLLKSYMAQHHIDSMSELAELSGISRRLLYDRIKDPNSLKVCELRALDNILHFSEDDILFLLRGSYENQADNIRRLSAS